MRLNITRLRQLAGRGVQEGQAIDPSNPDLVYTAGRKDDINLHYLLGFLNLYKY